MDREWNDNQPIYRQLRDRVVAMILEGALKEGDPLPSVRNLAADAGQSTHRSQGLPAAGRRGARREETRARHVRQNRLPQTAAARRTREFLSEEWPRICATMERLGFSPRELLEAANHRSPSKLAKEGR